MPGIRRKLRKAERFEERKRYGIHVYCTGCHRLFPKTHQLLNHRYTFRCGGNFLIEDEINGDLHAPLVPPFPAKRERRKKPRARRPGTVRTTRMPVGSGFRNNWQNRMPFDEKQLLKWKDFSNETIFKTKRKNT